jgi:hypothetical protein
MEQHDNENAEPIVHRTVESGNIKALINTIKPFKGALTDVQVWLNEWNSTIPLTGIPANSQVVPFVAKMDGHALTWIKKIIREREEEGNPPHTIQELKNLLFEKYNRPNYRFNSVMDMMAANQGSLSVEQYAEQVETAIDKASPNMEENLKVATFIRGLRPEIQARILMATQPETYIQAVTAAIAIENGLRFDKTKSASTHNVETDDTQALLAALVTKVTNLELKSKNEENNKNIPQTDTRICHYCKQPSHIV